MTQFLNDEGNVVETTFTPLAEVIAEASQKLEDLRRQATVFQTALQENAVMQEKILSELQDLIPK